MSHSFWLSMREGLITIRLLFDFAWFLFRICTFFVLYFPSLAICSRNPGLNASSSGFLQKLSMCLLSQLDHAFGAYQHGTQMQTQLHAVSFQAVMSCCLRPLKCGAEVKMKYTHLLWKYWCCREHSTVLGDCGGLRLTLCTFWFIKHWFISCCFFIYFLLLSIYMFSILWNTQFFAFICFYFCIYC